MKSWKTTAAGVIAALTAILGAASALLDGNPATNPDYATVVAAVVAAVGLVFARDASVSSEQQGIK